jgi:excisionase family DNA binding protein
MEGDNYNAKEAAEKLRLPSTTFYRKVKEGHIPYTGPRPMRFPKEAIDAIAEVDFRREEADKLLFKVSARSDLWKKRGIIKQTYGIEDPVPYIRALEWLKSNDEIFMQVNKGDNILGWVALFPLEEEIITALIEDKMKEKDIPPEAIKKWDDSQLSVYISILEVFKTTNKGADKAVAVFLIRKTIKWALTLIEQCDIKNWYGIGTNHTSQALLEALGFKQISSLDGEKRKVYRLDNLSRPAKLLKKFLRKH